MNSVANNKAVEFLNDKTDASACLVEAFIFNLGVFHKELGFVPFSAGKNEENVKNFKYDKLKCSVIDEQGFVLNKNNERQYHLSKSMDGYMLFGNLEDGALEQAMEKGDVSLKEVLDVFQNTKKFLGRSIDEKSVNRSQPNQRIVMSEDVLSSHVFLENNKLVVKEIFVANAGDVCEVKNGYFYKKADDNSWMSYRIVNHKHTVDDTFVPPVKESFVKKMVNKIFG